jgi:hypothetical protein
MSEHKFDHRGGGVDLSAEKPRGLPFLQPLYGLPPYQYTGDAMLMIAGETEEAAIQRRQQSHRAAI